MHIVLLPTEVPARAESVSISRTRLDNKSDDSNYSRFACLTDMLALVSPKGGIRFRIRISNSTNAASSKSEPMGSTEALLAPVFLLSHHHTGI